MEKSQVLLTSTNNVAEISVLKTKLGAQSAVALRRGWFGSTVQVSEHDVGAAVGWGMKNSSVALKEWAKANDTPFYYAEDGFLGYETHPSLGGSRLSVTLDPLSMHYNCIIPSSLELMIADHASWFNKMPEDVDSYIRAFVSAGLSKYNHASRLLSVELFMKLGNGRRGVLVVDQVAGDHSVMFSGATSSTFGRMLEAALEENPGSTIFLKAHPDTNVSRKKSYLKLSPKQRARVEIIKEDVTPATLFAFVSKVYTVSSLSGFEALLHGLDVVCFGMPFYAGWGLTDDRAPELSRRSQVEGVTKSVLFAAAYIKYPIYIDPYTGAETTFEKTLARLSVESRKPQFNASIIYVEKFSPLKRRVIKHYLGAICPESDVVFADFKVDVSRLRSGEALLVWGGKDDILAEQLPSGAQIWCVEDGFLRSVGLGSDLYLPSSLSIDDIGMHFDVFGYSRLEKLCLDERFEPFELDYAAWLIEQIKSHGITKYNVGDNAQFHLPKASHGKRVILVAGQVEGDRSIEMSGADIRTNYELLKCVRNNNPDAFIVYKPHPDVVSGNRSPEFNHHLISNYCDLKLSHLSMTACIEFADEVHVISSQSGFEALLYGKEVHCYGMPFYAGWGFTIDHGASVSWRRQNGHLTVEALFLCAYVIYPTYFDWKNHRKGGCQQLLSSWHGVSNQPISSKGRFWRKVKNAFR